VNELKPLLESSPNPATRSLLRAALPDKPPSDARRRTAITLGVGTTAGVAATSGGAAAAAGGTGITGLSAASSASTGTAIAAAKWLAGGLVMGSLVSGGAALVGDPSSRSAGVSSATTSAVASVPRASGIEARATHALAPAQPARVERSHPARKPASSIADESSSPNAMTIPRATANSGPQAALAPAPSSMATRGLGREVALIDAARRAVARGDANGAMSQLDRYSRVRETQILDREARLLRIDVLVLRGERERAAVLAREYLRQLPNDPHSARLRKLLQP
jgi:hypothetical protein